MAAIALIISIIINILLIMYSAWVYRAYDQLLVAYEEGVETGNVKTKTDR